MMHEIRSTALHGKQPRPLVAPKAQGADESKRGSLTAIPVKRQEPRLTNHRAEDRQRDVVDTAAVYFRRRKHMARVVNVSPHGAMVHADIEPRIGDSVEIQFADCNRTKCVVRWMKEGRLGLEFVGETVILGSIKDKNYIFESVLPEKTGEAGEHRPMYPRARRHGLIWTGTLYWTFEAFSVRLRNISADGAMLEGDCSIPVGSKVQLNMAEAGTLSGEVKWCEGKNIGVKFEGKFDLKLLALNKPDAPNPADAMLKPDYLKSEGSATSPWAAMWERLRPSDLQRF